MEINIKVAFSLQVQKEEMLVDKSFLLYKTLRQLHLAKSWMKSAYTETEMSPPNVVSQRMRGLITSSLIRKEKVQ